MWIAFLPLAAGFNNRCFVVIRNAREIEDLAVKNRVLVQSRKLIIVHRAEH